MSQKGNQEKARNEFRALAKQLREAEDEFDRFAEHEAETVRKVSTVRRELADAEHELGTAQRDLSDAMRASVLDNADGDASPPKRSVPQRRVMLRRLTH